MIAAAAAVLLAGALIVLAQDKRSIREFLTGYEEVPTLSTPAEGEFKARIRNSDQRVEWQLSYSDLHGDATQAHIHFGAKGTNGGIAVWLCGNVATTPVGVQPCPAPPATITGTFDADDVVGPAGQGIAPGEFGEVLRAMRQGLTYANVHSSLFPSGEIRSQIDATGRDHHGH